MGLIHSSIPGLLAFPASISEEIEELFPSLSEAPASVAADLNPWEMGWAKRGNYLNEKLGANLPGTFKTIDIFADGVATSIKSIDLNAATYQHATHLTYRLNEYVNKLADFEGDTLGDINIAAENITSRNLSIAIPKNSMTAVQQAAFEAARSRVEKLGIDLIVTEF